MDRKITSVINQKGGVGRVIYLIKIKNLKKING